MAVDEEGVLVDAQSGNWASESGGERWGEVCGGVRLVIEPVCVCFRSNRERDCVFVCLCVCAFFVGSGEGGGVGWGAYRDMESCFMDVWVCGRLFLKGRSRPVTVCAVPPARGRPRDGRGGSGELKKGGGRARDVRKQGGRRDVNGSSRQGNQRR